MPDPAHDIKVSVQVPNHYLGSCQAVAAATVVETQALKIPTAKDSVVVLFELTYDPLPDGMNAADHPKFANRTSRAFGNTDGVYLYAPGRVNVTDEQGNPKTDVPQEVTTWIAQLSQNVTPTAVDPVPGEMHHQYLLTFDTSTIKDHLADTIIHFPYGVEFYTYEPPPAGPHKQHRCRKDPEVDLEPDGPA